MNKQNGKDMVIDSIIQVNQQLSENSVGPEKLKRSFVKTLSWRIIGTADTILISYLLTGRVDVALSIGGIELVTKMTLYFIHERVWNKIKWGK